MRGDNILATLDRDPAASGEPTIVGLRGWETFDEGAASIRALLFGALADITVDIVKHYRSDYYHDALWIAENVNGPTTFYLAVNEYGTVIGDRDLCVTAVRSLGRDHVWRVDLVSDASEPDATGADAYKARGYWSAVLTRLDGEALCRPN